MQSQRPPAGGACPEHASIRLDHGRAVTPCADIGYIYRWCFHAIAFHVCASFYHIQIRNHGIIEHGSVKLSHRCTNGSSKCALEAIQYT